MSVVTTRAADSAGVDRTAYPFDDKWRPLRAGRMHYVDEGAGEPIVFSHGTPTWSFEWRHLVRALSPEYRTIAPDHLGFGLSERPHGAPYTPEWHAENFVEFVESLDLGPLTLVVHDFGGPIALPLALRRPDLVKRPFMLGPMADLAPDLVHPTLKVTIGELWRRFDQAAHPMIRVPAA